MSARPALLTLILALAAQPVLAAQPANGDDPAAEPLLTRVYDLAGLGPDHRHDGVQLALLPFGRDAHDPPAAPELAELVYTLLHDVVAPEELQYEGRSVEFLGEERLSVTAPAAVHADAQRLLDALAAGFRRRATLELSVARLDDGPAPAQVLAERSPAELRSAGLLRTEQVQRVELFVGQGQRVRAVVRRQIVRGWDAEIAEQSCSVRPESRELRTGVDLLLRLEDEPGGGHTLRLAGRLGVLARHEVVDVGVETRVMNEANHALLTSSEPLDETVVSWAALTGAARLQPGDSVHELVWTRTESGAAGWLVGLRLVSVEPVPVARFGERALAVLDLSSRRWGGQRAARIHRYEHAEHPREVIWPEADHHWLRWDDGEDVPVLPLALAGAELEAAASGVLEALYDVDGQPWTDGAWAVVHAPAGALQRWLDGSWAGLGARAGLILEVGVDGQARGDATLAGEQARLHLPLLVGDALTVLLGDAHSYVPTYDVDVASRATARFPLVADALDGLLVSARASTRHVELEVELARLLGWEPFAFGSHKGDAVLDRPRMLSGRLSARLEPDGARRVLGVLAPGGDDDARLTVWARLRRAD